MKKILLFCLLFNFTACMYKEGNKGSSGGLPRDLIASDALPSLSYRIKQEAIDLHHFQALLSESKHWSDHLIPSSWPLIQFETVSKAFCYLHSEAACSLKVESFNLENLNSADRKIDFNLPLDQIFTLFINQSVTELSWQNSLSQKVEMTKQSSSTWSFTSENETLLWTPIEKKLCYIENCIHF